MKTGRVLALVGLAASMTSFALGQAAFKVVKVPNSTANTSTAINNSGNVLVNADTSSSFNVSLWNRLQGSQSLGLQGGTNVGVAIDAGNDVAGVGQQANGDLEAYLWDADGSTHALGDLGGGLSAANSVNASRQVVGMSFTSAGLPHAFLWTQKTGMQDLTPQLSSLGGASAMGINTSGDVVGYYFPNGASNTVGFNWTQAGGIQSFGAPGTLAFGVNDAGTIVGQALTANGYKHAFSYTQSGSMVDLGTLGGDTSSALAINNKGWIVGTSLAPGKTGYLHGFLWTPTGGMQDFTTLAGLAAGQQPYSVGLNDYGDIALSTNHRLLVLVPIITAKATSSQNPSKVGQTVTFTATTTSIAGPPPDGETLTFTINGQSATGTMTKGVAQATFSGLTAGSHVLAVSYAGDAYYLSFRYTPVTQVVNP
jgi:probable HAF family extracellular repeat protein